MSSQSTHSLHMKQTQRVTPLFLAIRMVQAMVFFRIHGLGHFIGQHCTVTVLEWPHAPKIKKAHTVTITQDVPEVGLKTGHGTQLTIDR